MEHGFKCCFILSGFLITNGRVTGLLKSRDYWSVNVGDTKGISLLDWSLWNQRPVNMQHENDHSDNQGNSGHVTRTAAFLGTKPELTRIAGHRTHNINFTLEKFAYVQFYLSTIYRFPHHCRRSKIGSSDQSREHRWPSQKRAAPLFPGASLVWLLVCLAYRVTHLLSD